MKAPKDKKIDGRKSPADECASYVTTPLYKRLAKSTQRFTSRGAVHLQRSGSLVVDPKEDTSDARI